MLGCMYTLGAMVRKEIQVGPSHHLDAGHVVFVQATYLNHLQFPFLSTLLSTVFFSLALNSMVGARQHLS